MARPLGIGDEEGQTPLDDDELAALLVPATSRAALNEVEAINIADATAWIARSRLTAARVLDELFIRDLHRRMFGDVWSWAGQYRMTDKNLGVPWTDVRVAVHQVVLDAREWLATGMDVDESAVRFGHRLVWVHPFPNGNGRHSRTASDCLAQALGQRAFTWGGGGAIEGPGTTRGAYLTALRAADGGDLSPLQRFARS